MGKKIFINGKWLVVKDGDVQDTDEEPTEETTEETTDEGAEDEKAIKAEANKLADQIVENVTKNININNDVNKQLENKVDRMFDMFVPKDSKLREILNGKDVFNNTDELTKEEKIVGFYHALLTNNQPVLKALSEGTNADGGFLFPNEFLNEMVQELPNINVMRNWVRIIPMRRNVMNITNLVSGPEVTWTAENATKSTTTARFSQLTLTARKVASILYSSDELIEDSDIFDVVQMIIQLFAESIADEEERVIWAGNGTTEPTGINTAGTIGTVASVNQDFDDLIRVFHNLPRKYRTNSAWFMNDTTAQNVRLLKDSNNNYIWSQHDVQSAPSGSILGKPVVISDWVPDNSIFFGDMKKCYFLGDRQRMSVKISQDTTQAFTQDMTAIRVVARIGGIVAQPLACRELTGF